MRTYKQKAKWNEIDNNILSLKKENIGLLIDRDILNKIPYYMCPVIKDGLVGFVNSNGEVVITPQYIQVSGPFDTSDSFVAFKTTNNRCGVINAEGETVLEPIYKEVYITKDIAVVRNINLQYAVINVRTSKIIVDFGTYAWIEKGFVGGKYARVIVHRKADSQKTFDETKKYLDPSMVKLDGSNDSWGIIDETGKVILPIIYDRLCCLHINEEGKPCVQCEWNITIKNNNGDLCSTTMFSNPFIVKTLRNLPIPQIPVEGPEERKFSHYEEFAGSYAQDVMGFSDEDINDAFDGDPDAYWNID